MPYTGYAIIVSMHLSHAEFDHVVEEALEALPTRFTGLLENLAIIVEEEPSDDDLESLPGETDDDSELLGIYRGVARPRRTHDMLPMLPDQIAIFRGPILRVSRTRGEARRQIRETVLHELGHYFGLGDDEMSY